MRCRESHGVLDIGDTCDIDDSPRHTSLETLVGRVCDVPKWITLLDHCRIDDRLPINELHGVRETCTPGTVVPIVLDSGTRRSIELRVVREADFRDGMWVNERMRKGFLEGGNDGLIGEAGVAWKAFAFHDG